MVLGGATYGSSLFQQPASAPQGGEIWQALQTYTGRLQALDQDAFRRLTRLYIESLPDIQAEVSRYGSLITEMQQRGLEPSASWLFQHQRYIALEQQVQAGIGEFSALSGQTAREYQMKALQVQQQFYERLASGQASFGDAGDLRTWARLPERSLQAFAGLSSANPLFRQLAATSSTEAMYAMRNTLGSAIATGRDWRSTARLLRDRVAGLTLTRAQTITRTEVARARRAAALASFQQNPLVRGWVWRAALDRSCPACIALHGREFPTDEMQAGHPNCRCVMIPMRSRGTNVDIGTGNDYLMRELAAGGPQRINEILGKGRAEYWRTEMNRLGATGMPLRLAGQQALGNMATFYPNPAWGGMYRPTTLRNLRGGPASPLPPTAPRGGPAGGFNATPDYSTTERTAQWYRQAGPDAEDPFGTAAQANKAQAQAAVQQRIRNDPAVREWAERFGEVGRFSDELEYDDFLKTELRSMVDQWAATSGDSDSRAVAMQIAAQKEFGLSSAITRHFGKLDWRSGAGSYSSYDEWFRALVQPNLNRYEVFDRAVLRAQYEITQQAFRDAGITHVTLFRSAGTSGAPGSILDRIARASTGGSLESQSYLGNLELQPLSSFTLKPSVTGGFGNVFYQTTVPVEFIHSTARTGLGCLNEWEFVVMATQNAPATLTMLSRVRAEYSFWNWAPGSEIQLMTVERPTVGLWTSEVPLPP